MINFKIGDIIEKNKITDKFHLKIVCMFGDADHYPVTEIFYNNTDDNIAQLASHIRFLDAFLGKVEFCNIRFYYVQLLLFHAGFSTRATGHKPV